MRLALIYILSMLAAVLILVFVPGHPILMVLTGVILMFILMTLYALTDKP